MSVRVCVCVCVFESVCACVCLCAHQRHKFPATGKSVSEHTEVVGVDSALRFINASLLHRVGDISLQDLLDIHLRVVGHTDPPLAGHLRTTQVRPGYLVPLVLLWCLVLVLLWCLVLVLL